METNKKKTKTIVLKTVFILCLTILIFGRPLKYIISIKGGTFENIVLNSSSEIIKPDEIKKISLSYNENTNIYQIENADEINAMITQLKDIKFNMILDQKKLDHYIIDMGAIPDITIYLHTNEKNNRIIIYSDLEKQETIVYYNSIYYSIEKNTIESILKKAP